MSKKGIIQNAVIIVLGLAIICMSVGYAAFDGNKSSETSPVFEKSYWDVHLENPVRTMNSTMPLSGVITPPSVNSTGTEVSFGLNLKANEVYEFSVDVRNAGTIDAKSSSYALTATQDGMPVAVGNGSLENAVLSYEVLGDDNEILPKGQITSKIVRITASPNISADASYDFKFIMTYVANK